MNSVVIIENLDGTISILNPAPDMFNVNSRTREMVPELKNKSDEEVLQWIINKDVPQGLVYTIVNKNSLPSDRYFRNAWKSNKGKIEIDYPKAVEIKLDVFRELRKPLLKELDIAYQRADELGDVVLKQDIATQKQELRDVTTIELPKTVPELKGFTPAILKGK